MDFFGQQDEARARSRRLVWLFAGSLLGLTLAFYACLVLAEPFVTGRGSAAAAGEPLFDWWQPSMLFWTTVFVVLSIGLTSYLKLRSLRAGGASVAEALGARLIDPATVDLDERQLLNVVEEMSIASGVPVPQVFVMYDEPGINAFAAGYSPADAAVAVTRGTLRLLNRDELQGVVAHEFSHILNGDMRLNIRLIAIIYGLSLLGSTGVWIMRSSLRVGSGSSRRRNGGTGAWQVALAGAVLAALGYLGVFFGRLIQSAVSRQREFLADAAAVQFTRNPDGLASALRKVGGFHAGSAVRHHRIEELSHLFFGDAIASRWTSFLATHPPLVERIRRLDPSFQGEFAAVDAPAGYFDAPQRPDPFRHRNVAPQATGLSAVAQGVGHEHLAAGRGAPEHPVALAPESAWSDTGAAAFGSARPRRGSWLTSSSDHASIAPDEIVRQVGAVTPAHIRWSAQLLREIPDALREATRSPFDAMALCHAVLLDRRAEARRSQLDALARLVSPETLSRVLELEPEARRLDPRARLPLLEMGLASLRRLSDAQYESFLQGIDASVKADDRITLFEFALSRSLTNTLERSRRGNAPVPVQYLAIRAVLQPITVLLSGIAIAGAEDPMEALVAFRAGRDRIPALKRANLEIVSPSACSVDALGEALDRLAASSHGIRKLALDACAHAVLADEDVTLAEAELLRVVADSLACPLPPFLPARVRVPE